MPREQKARPYPGCVRESKDPGEKRKEQKHETRNPRHWRKPGLAQGQPGEAWTSNRAITSCDCLNPSCLQRERALGSDRWSLASLAVLVGGSGCVQSVPRPAAAAAEGGRACAHSPDTALVGNTQPQLPTELGLHSNTRNCFGLNSQPLVLGELWGWLL